VPTRSVPLNCRGIGSFSDPSTSQKLRRRPGALPSSVMVEVGVQKSPQCYCSERFLGIVLIRMSILGRVRVVWACLIPDLEWPRKSASGCQQPACRTASSVANRPRSDPFDPCSQQCSLLLASDTLACMPEKCHIPCYFFLFLSIRDMCWTARFRVGGPHTCPCRSVASVDQGMAELTRHGSYATIRI
jgi:hypothetical protein